MPSQTTAAAADTGTEAERPASQAGTARTWQVASLFLVASTAADPKLLAVTSDGLINLWVIAAMALALRGRGFFLRAILPGMLLAQAVLVKQTAVFFALPLFLFQSPRRRGRLPVTEWIGIALGAALILIPSVWALGANDFYYWNWTYPSEVLVGVRSRLFSTYRDLAGNSAFFALALFPLVWALPGRSLRKLVRAWDFRVLWLVAGALAMLAGKGVFLHYYLLLVPAGTLLVAQGWEQLSRAARRGAGLWLGAGYLAATAVLAIPGSTIFWGTDLPYYAALAQPVQQSIPPEGRILLWSGSPLLLAFVEQRFATRFPVPRFAEAPYGTPHTRELLEQDLETSDPALVLDLHERGDNQFSNQVASDAGLRALLARGYKLYLSPPIPWAKFYLRQPPSPQAALVEVPLGSEMAKTLYAPFPEKPNSWSAFFSVLTHRPWHQTLHRLNQVDATQRAQAALELLRRQSFSPELYEEVRQWEDRLGAGLGGDQGSASGAVASGTFSGSPSVTTATPLDPTRSAELAEFFSRRGDPLPWRSRFWWPEEALVQLQPRAR